ncbi:MAG: type I restriction enzyme HsdR N-terminal domain-containing protein [Bacteroidia bacterium]
MPLFSEFPPQLRDQEGQAQIYDPFRKVWVADAPEERVRQGLLQHIHVTHKIGAGRIAIEREIQYHQLKKRFDVLVFDQDGKPWIVCECKAPEVSITQETLYQIGRYNAVLQAPHLLVTNGLQYLFFSKNNEGGFDFIPDGWVDA